MSIYRWLCSRQDVKRARFQLVMNKASSKRFQYVMDYIPTQHPLGMILHHP